jgi:hypothetical protein
MNGHRQRAVPRGLVEDGDAVGAAGVRQESPAQRRACPREAADETMQDIIGNREENEVCAFHDSRRLDDLGVRKLITGSLFGRSRHG